MHSRETKEIKSICKKLEKEKGVKILFAVESGSRVWRISSVDSDFDVRFVFVRPFKEYLRINKPVDFIEYKEDNVDAAGFDLYKFCGLLLASNPTVIEWLLSDIVYYGKQPKELIDFAEKNFNPIALYYHYKSMCKQNYRKYLQGGQKITYKKYLYATRGLINAKIVAEKQTIPPINFLEALEISKAFIPRHIHAQLGEIIELKKQDKEETIVKNLVSVDEFIESELKKEEKIQSIKKPQMAKEINQYILKTLKLL